MNTFMINTQCQVVSIKFWKHQITSYFAYLFRVHKIYTTKKTRTLEFTQKFTDFEIVVKSKTKQQSK